MRDGLNKVFLIGRIGQQPELKGNNDSVLVFSLATTERYKDREGEWKDRTEWHKIVVFGNRAAGLYKILGSGMPLFIEGKNQTRSWEDNDGNKRYTTEVVARDVKLLGSKKDNSGRREDDGYGDYEGPSGGADQFDESDIPF